MLALERHRRILDALKRQPSVRVAELATRFEVTEETIRRDLDKLGKAGRLVRTHGGALPARSEKGELSLPERETRFLAEKDAIAAKVASLIEPGDTLFLDASSTAHRLARALPDIVLTVITNALAVVTELEPRTNIKVVLVGGVLDRASHSMVGPSAVQSLDAYHAGKLFISCQGVDLDRGLSVAWEEQAEIKRHMLDRADRRILLVDHSKFGVKSTYFFGTLEDVDVVVTDNGADPALLDELRGRSVDVLVADAP